MSFEKKMRIKKLTKLNTHGIKNLKKNWRFQKSHETDCNKEMFLLFDADK